MFRRVNGPALFRTEFLLGCAASGVEVRLTHRDRLLGVQRDEVFEVLWNPGILEDRLNWTLGLTSAAVNALIRVNHEHSNIVAFRLATVLVVILLLLNVVEAVDRANLNARTILGSQTIYSNNVSHVY